MEAISRAIKRGYIAISVRKLRRRRLLIQNVVVRGVHKPRSESWKTATNLRKTARDPDLRLPPILLATPQTTRAIVENPHQVLSATVALFLELQDYPIFDVKRNSLPLFIHADAAQPPEDGPPSRIVAVKEAQETKPALLITRQLLNDLKDSAEVGKQCALASLKSQEKLKILQQLVNYAHKELDILPEQYNRLEIVKASEAELQQIGRETRQLKRRLELAQAEMQAAENSIQQSEETARSWHFHVGACLQEVFVDSGMMVPDDELPAPEQEAEFFES